MDPKTPLGVAALLTWAAGYVDAVGYVSIAHIYTANMSGNSVSVGIQLASHHWPEMLLRLWPVVTYVVGLLFCRLLIEFGARERIRSIASVAFLIELGLLAPMCFLRIPPTGASVPLSYICIALLAIAMGIQNAALTHFSSLTLHTGFVTGTLVKFAEQFAKFLTWVFDQVRDPRSSFLSALRHAPQQRPFQVSFWLAAIWLLYVIGAACGMLGDANFNLTALAAPILCLVLLIFIDISRPLALQDEKDQLT